VEQKQANALLSNLSQILPDNQPQSATEISLLNPEWYWEKLLTI
jgi:tyrosine-protein kinase Etk/Wzc